MAKKPFLNSKVLRSSGEFLEVKDAAEYLQNFYKSEESSVLGEVRKTVVSGQVIGLDLLKTFVNAIDEYNKKTEVRKDKIVAVRIYSSLSNRHDSRTLPDTVSDQMPNKNIRDIILEPVLADGRDYHNLKKSPIGKDKLLVGMALPCPNVCPKAFDC